MFVRNNLLLALFRDRIYIVKEKETSRRYTAYQKFAHSSAFYEEPVYMNETMRP